MYVCTSFGLVSEREVIMREGASSSQGDPPCRSRLNTWKTRGWAKSAMSMIWSQFSRKVYFPFAFATKKKLVGKPPYIMNPDSGLQYRSF